MKMKKLIALLLACVVVFSCGCGAKSAPAPAATEAPAEAEATPEATAEPTPEPTPICIEMDCPMTDVLDADQQSFLSSIRSDPPAVASVYLDGEYPETIVLDLDTVRKVCSSIYGLKVIGEVVNPTDTADNHISLTRDNGETITINFLGDKLYSLDSCYMLENADEFWKLLNDICEKSAKDAEANKKAIASGEYETVEYENVAEAYKMKLTHHGLETIGVSENNWQTLRTTIGVTNTGPHIIMSAKIIAKYLNEDGYVIAEVPDYLNFNAVPVLLNEYREFILDEKVYNPGDSTECAASDVIITIVNINAPNEAGH